jgi:hypothetical protein
MESVYSAVRTVYLKEAVALRLLNVKVTQYRSLHGC